MCVHTNIHIQDVQSTDREKNYHVNYKHKKARMKMFILYTEEQNIKASKEKKRHVQSEKVRMPTVFSSKPMQY